MEYESHCLVRTAREAEEILKAQDRVLALFFASWCPFCVKFLPIFSGCVQENGLFFLRVQDDEESIADRYAVKIYPTVLFFKGGEIAGRLDGRPGVGLTDKQLEEFIRSCQRD